MFAFNRFKRVLWVLIAVLVLAILTIWLLLRGSLPQLEGRVQAAGLSDKVSVMRNERGVPVIEGASREDVAYATGFTHAQERFFQMDTLRRGGAGELAELLGPSVLPVDKERRLHRARSHATALLASLPPAERQLLERYTAGVNDGLAGLKVRPVEYLMLRSQPKPWTAVDSLLVIWAMYFDLQQYQKARALSLAWFRGHTTPAQFAFFFPPASNWDAPLDAPGISAPALPIPDAAPDWMGPAVKASATSASMAALDTPLPMVGSNSWAIAGSRSTNGLPVIANDMHLQLSLPNNWYRAVLLYRTASGEQRRVAGVTLPGLPYVVVGSNGKVAWGLTNSFCECVRLLPLETDPANPQRVRSAKGWEQLTRVQETIRVQGGAPVMLDIRQTSLGPVLDVEQRPYAMQWAAAQAGAINLRFAELEAASDVNSALASAAVAGIPAQNFIVGDAAGHIGWTIAGGLLAPAGAEGLLPAAAHPKLIDPAGGRLWTANNRQLAGAGAELIGDGGADIGARATRIRDRLAALPERATPQQVADIALDTEAVFLAPWRERLLRLLDDKALAGQPQRAEYRRLIQSNWSGRADSDSVGYTLVREYFYALYRRLFGRVNETLRGISMRATFNVTTPRWSETTARLIDQAPERWLPGGMSWREVQLAALDDAIAILTENKQPLASAKWGEHNKVAIKHRFARGFPVLNPVLSAPAQPQAGDDYMPRVAMPGFGQSMRMVVSPGQEDQGRLIMPGGQSGHPFSRHFLADQQDWLDGRSGALLSDGKRTTLVLTPK